MHKIGPQEVQCAWSTERKYKRGGVAWGNDALPPKST